MVEGKIKGNNSSQNRYQLACVTVNTFHQSLSEISAGYSVVIWMVYYFTLTRAHVTIISTVPSFFEGEQFQLRVKLGKTEEICAILHLCSITHSYAIVFQYPIVWVHCNLSRNEQLL